MELAPLRLLIRNAARTAFTDLGAQHPEESFYVFALQSLDDASGVYPAANTETGYRRCIAKYADRMEPPGDRYCRWYFCEWAYSGIGSEHFREVYHFINKVNKNYRDNDLWLRFKAIVFASMALALRDLDREGIFGSGREREHVTLFCTLDDSYSTAWLEEESARWLNPPGVYRAFARRSDADTSAKESLHPLVERIRLEFVRILNERGEKKD
jgi:hypothetical protein